MALIMQQSNINESSTFFEPSASFFLMLKMSWKRSFRSITRGSAWKETRLLVCFHLRGIQIKFSLYVKKKGVRKMSPLGTPSHLLSSFNSEELVLALCTTHISERSIVCNVASNERDLVHCVFHQYCLQRWH